MLVSHDRALLADAAVELVELDARTGSATHYAGGWDAYDASATSAAAEPRLHTIWPSRGAST